MNLSSKLSIKNPDTLSQKSLAKTKEKLSIKQKELKDEVKQCDLLDLIIKLADFTQLQIDIIMSTLGQMSKSKY